MSRRRYNYGAASNSGGWKFLSVVQFLISIALAIVIVCAVGSEGFTKKDVKTWFSKDQEQSEPNGDGEQKGSEQKGSEDEEKKEIKTKLLFMDEDSGVVLNSEISEVMTFALADEQPEEEDSVTIDVTVTPDYATVSLETVELSFVDSSSEWATGKTVTDYVTVNYNGKKTLKITCNEAFGERIKLTCSCFGTEGILTASCFIDYRQKYLGSYGIDLTSGNGGALDYSVSNTMSNKNIVSNLVDIVSQPNFDEWIYFSISLSPVFTIPLEGTVSFNYKVWGNYLFNEIAEEYNWDVRIYENDNTVFQAYNVSISSMIRQGNSNTYTVPITDTSIENFFRMIIADSSFDSGKTFGEVYDDFCRGANFYYGDQGTNLLEYELEISLTIDGQTTWENFGGTIGFNERAFYPESIELPDVVF